MHGPCACQCWPRVRPACVDKRLAVKTDVLVMYLVATFGVTLPPSR